MSIEGFKPLNDNTNSIFSYVLAFWLVQSTDLHRQDLVMPKLTKRNTWTHNLAAPLKGISYATRPKRFVEQDQQSVSLLGRCPRSTQLSLLYGRKWVIGQLNVSRKTKVNTGIMFQKRPTTHQVIQHLLENQGKHGLKLQKGTP